MSKQSEAILEEQLVAQLQKIGYGLRSRMYFVCSAKASFAIRALSFKHVLSYHLHLKLPVVPQNDYRAVTRPSDCSDILCWSVSGSKDTAESAAACRGPKRILNYEL